jgi:hypothetical protein
MNLSTQIGTYIKYGVVVIHGAPFLLSTQQAASLTIHLWRLKKFLF